MRDEINKVPQAMCEGLEPIKDIRQAARSMADIAISNYTGYLLKSALTMVCSVVQFANDLEGGDKAQDEI